MPTHMNMRWEEVETLWGYVAKIQEMASKEGISDIFADNGGKVFQISEAIGLSVVPGRLGADLEDRVGNKYELKTADTTKKVRGFSTNHHLHGGTIARYRDRRFVFALYEGIQLNEVYLVEREDLEPIYQKWERTLKGKSHLNNPKIPIVHIREVGKPMYLKDVPPPWAEGPE